MVKHIFVLIKNQLYVDVCEHKQFLEKTKINKQRKDHTHTHTQFLE